MKKSPLFAVPRGSAGLNGAVAGRVCVVVAAGTGIVAVGYAVGTVLGVVVGRTSAASADNVDGDDDDQEQHGAGDYDHVESDTDASVGLLCRSSGPQRHDGKDKSGDCAGQADERCAAADQSDDGEDESTYGHSRVILLWRRLVSCRHRCRLACYHDSSAGTSDWRLVSISTIVIGGRLGLRREPSRSGLVFAFGILLVILRGSHCVRSLGVAQGTRGT